MSSIELDQVTKEFGGQRVVHSTSLRIEQGELVTLLGPSGSGKSTILSMIAGLLVPSSGRILIGEHDVTHQPPAKRNLGMVFQSYALFPHMTVFENVSFPLQIRKLPKSDIAAKVKRALEMVRLEGLENRKQTELSGGQQQRVALARALVFEPEILLLDEPMGALDKKLREQVQIELRGLQRDLGVTTILVTHDQEEALSLSTRVVVLESGQIQQVDAPEQLYRCPQNRFVAEFVGSANLWPGQAMHEFDETVVTLAAGMTLTCRNRQGLHGSVLMMLRPEDIEVHTQLEGAGCLATVKDLVYLGQNTRVYCQTHSGLSAIASLAGIRPLEIGQAVRLHWASDHVWLLSDQDDMA